MKCKKKSLIGWTDCIWDIEFEYKNYGKGNTIKFPNIFKLKKLCNPAFPRKVRITIEEIK